MLWYNRYQALVFRVPAIGIFVVPPCYFRYPLFVISFFPVYLLLLFVSLFYGQAARYYDYDRFTYPWHFHSQYEIIYVRNSSGRCFVGDCIERFSDGDVILFGPNLPHYMRSDDAYHCGNPLLRVQGTIIQFEENFMQYSFDHYPQFHQIRLLLKEAKRGVVFHTADDSPARDMVSAFPELKGFGQITGLLDLLQGLSVSSPKKMLASPCYYEKFPTAGNYTRSLKLDEIAEMANMNSSAFCRFFKEVTEKTFLQYVTDMRIGYACKLLTIGDMEISQIAVECGFDSISHFNRTFKQLTGLTPTQYRNQIMK